MSLRDKAEKWLTPAVEGDIAKQQSQFERQLGQAFREAKLKLMVDGAAWDETLQIGYALITKSYGTGPLPCAKNLLHLTVQRHKLANEAAREVSRNASFHSNPDGCAVGGGQPFPAV